MDIDFPHRKENNHTIDTSTQTQIYHLLSIYLNAFKVKQINK